MFTHTDGYETYCMVQCVEGGSWQLSPAVAVYETFIVLASKSMKDKIPYVT